MSSFGIKVPDGELVDTSNAANIAENLGFPVILKLNSSEIAHKTEVGAVSMGLNNKNDVEQALKQIQSSVNKALPELAAGNFLIEKMLPTPIAELMVNIRRDSQFGLVMTLSSGGILVEILADAITLILPANEAEILNALNALKLSKLFTGFRGSSGVNIQMLVDCIQRLIDYVVDNQYRIAEIEINPLFVYTDEVYAVDVLTHVYHSDVDEITPSTTKHN